MKKFRRHFWPETLPTDSSYNLRNHGLRILVSVLSYRSSSIKTKSKIFQIIFGIKTMASYLMTEILLVPKLGFAALLEEAWFLYLLSVLRNMSHN